jgi:hypothetical protein
MKPTLPLVVFTAVLPLLHGCVSTSGTPGYPAGHLNQPPTGPIGTGPVDTNVVTATSLTELLNRKAQLEFPAKVLVVRLGYQRQTHDSTVRRAIEEAIAADPVLKPAELVFTDTTVRWSRQDRSQFDDLQALAARFQARYVLMYDYEFNVANRTYWLPACVVMGTLGLIPMPVGGETIYCTSEFVVMDVPTGLFLTSAQGQAKDQRTAVWGWMFDAGGGKPGEEAAIRDALKEALPNLTAQVRQLMDRATTTTAP